MGDVSGRLPQSTSTHCKGFPSLLPSEYHVVALDTLLLDALLDALPLDTLPLDSLRLDVLLLDALPFEGVSPEVLLWLTKRRCGCRCPRLLHA